MELCIRQNNAIDKYEQYFEDEEEEEENHNAPYAKTMNVLRYSWQPALRQTDYLLWPTRSFCGWSCRDPHQVKRTVTSLSWSPDRGRKLAAAYSSVVFQQTSQLSTDSYIWDVGGSDWRLHLSQPTFLSVHKGCCIFQKSPAFRRWCWSHHPPSSAWSTTQGSPTLLWEAATMDKLVGLCLGKAVKVCVCDKMIQIQMFASAYWDTRRGCQTVAYSSVEHSHKDPVYKVIWLQSKTGTDAFSASTDGQVNSSGKIHPTSDRCTEREICNQKKKNSVMRLFFLPRSGFVVGCTEAEWANRAVDSGSEQRGEPGPGFRRNLSRVWDHHGERMPVYPFQLIYRGVVVVPI